MEIVAAAAGDDINLPGSGAAIFRAVGILRDLEFLNGILRGDDSDHIEIRAVGGHAIDEDLTLSGLAATNLKIASREGIRPHRVAHGRIARRGLALRHDSRR